MRLRAPVVFSLGTSNSTCTVARHNCDACDSIILKIKFRLAVSSSARDGGN